MSSVAVYGAAIGTVDEDALSVSPVTEYGAGKRQAERICQVLRANKVSEVADRRVILATCLAGLVREFMAVYGRALCSVCALATESPPEVA